ncbi:MAG TPA: PAS domain-containing protein [Smithella sp.]|jgi:PAS domain-containing protein|nr:PAS domain-containing protein [Smithella sp.]HQL98842.1 PAS domain-containing protein [Smithella sp.]
MNEPSKIYQELAEENYLLRQKVQELEIIAGERRKAEKGLRDSENKYKILTEKMSDIAWIADMNLKTLYVTPSIQTVLGFSQEERIFQNITEQLTPDSLSRVMMIESFVSTPRSHAPHGIAVLARRACMS